METKSSLRAVNLLFLGMLCLELANAFFAWMPQYVRLILNEALFVFLPAYLYLRFTRQPIRERVRWRWPGWKVALLSLLIGAGLYPLSAAGAGLLIKLLGYTNFAAPPDAIPTTALMGVLAIVAYAVMAPLCEEFFFRGVIQPVYEPYGAKWAVLFVGLLFTAFHFSLLQGLSIIPLVLALGYVNYRTRSLPASILTHVGANGLSALVLTAGVFRTGIGGWIVSLPALLGGLLISLLALLALIRLTRPAALPAANTAAPTAKPTRPLRLANAWPLLAALLLYLPVIGMEFVTSRTPQAAAAPLELAPAAWQSPQEWNYEIRNVLDEAVGEGNCRLEVQGANAELTCTSSVIAYEAKRGNSTFTSSGGSRTDTLSWRLEDGQMLAGASHLELSDGSFTSDLEWSLDGNEIQVQTRENGGETKTASLPLEPTAGGGLPVVLNDNTWPWQLVGIKQETGAGGRVLRFNPYTWRAATQDSGPLSEPLTVKVLGKESLSLPAGSFSAWKVSLGEDKTAYLNVQSMAPVQFSNGIETWVLK